MDILMYDWTIYNQTIYNLENDYENQIYSIVPIVGIGKLPTR